MPAAEITAALTGIRSALDITKSVTTRSQFGPAISSANWFELPLDEGDLVLEDHAFRR